MHVSPVSGSSGTQGRIIQPETLWDCIRVWWRRRDLVPLGDVDGLPAYLDLAGASAAHHQPPHAGSPGATSQ